MAEGGEFPIKVPSLTVPLLLFLGSVLLSLKNSSFKVPVLHALFWQFLLFLFYCSASDSNEKENDLIFKAVALSSLLCSVYGILQFFGLDFISWSTTWGNRPSSTFGNPNFAAGWWVMTLPLFASQFLTGRSASRWVWLGLSLLAAANLYVGRTRGAWIAVLISMILGAIHKIPSKRTVYFISAFWCLLFFAALGAGVPRHWASGEEPSVIERVFKWTTAWEMVKDYPVFGVGAENLKVKFALYQSDVKKRVPFKDSVSLRSTSEANVHNEYFQIWAEQGTFGLASFLLIFAVWYVRFINRRDSLSQETWTRKCGIASAVFSFLFYSLTNFPLHIVPNSCLLFFLLAASEEKISPPVRGKTGKSDPARDLPRAAHPNNLLRIALASLFIGVFCKIIFPPLYADILRLDAEKSRSAHDLENAISLYRRSMEMDFYRSERTAYELGECYRMKGQFQSAIDAYKVSALLRNYGEIYNDMGNCYYLLGNKEGAMENWGKALRLGLPDEAAQKQTEKNLNLLRLTEEGHK